MHSNAIVQSGRSADDALTRAFGARTGLGTSPANTETQRERDTREKPCGPEPVLIAADEVATIVGMSVRTLHRFTSSGVFPKPAVKIGKKYVRWERATVEAWIRQQANGGAA